MFIALSFPLTSRKLVTGWLLILLTTCALAPCRGQTTYYVNAAGSDANTGRSAATPFQSLSRINRLILQPGDSVLLRRGDTFRGSLQIRQSGLVGRSIVISAYGSGAKPIISGSVPVSNWTSAGKGVWKASCPTCGDRVTGVFRDETALPLGRFPNPDAPNKGYLTVKSHVGKTQLTSQQALLTDWTGGEVVTRSTQWIIDRAFINRQTGNTLTLTNKSNYELTDSRGYFIQDHLATLDQPNEWYYDPATKVIYLYDNQANPNQDLITATAYGRGIDLANVSYITLRNLHVTQTMTESLYANNVSTITLTDNDFTNAGEDGVIIIGSGSGIMIANNRIATVNNNGFWIDGYQNVTIRDNTFRRIGAWPGRGKSGDGQYNGLHSVSKLNTLIENNVVDSIGYIGIDLSYSSNTVLQRNTISNFCLVKSDGGGIYLWNGNKLPTSNVHIVSNIIHGGIGAPEINDTTQAGANGIFLDDCLQQVNVANNTVFDCHGYGIYLHAVSGVKVTGNTSFNNSISQFTMYDNGGICDMRENLVKKNVFVSKLPVQFVAVYASYTNDLNRYGSLDSNYYARPFADAFKIRAVYNKNIGDDLTLAQWATKYGQDSQSRNSSLTFNGHKVTSISQANRISNTFASTSENWADWSNYNNGRIAWDNTGRLDGGSLRASFPVSSTGSDSYMLLTKSLGAVAKSQSYLVRFDAVASANTRIQVFIRKRDSPFQDLDKRFDVLVGTTRASYEFAFTSTDNEANALLVYEIRESNQSVYFDNIRLQEAVITKTNPDEYIRLIYNPTQRDSTITLVGNYRDLKNRSYSRQAVLAPFASIILLKDTLPLVDVSLTLRTDKQLYRTGETVSFLLTLRNGTSTAEKVQWNCRLPAALPVITANGLQYTNGTLSGTVLRLLKDTTFVFVVRPMASGLYQVAAQVTSAPNADPDSRPDSGTADGEDDTAMASFIVGGSGRNVVVIPTKKQAAPAPAANKQARLSALISPVLVPPAQADLSLRLVLSNRVPALNDLISCTIWVHNEGPAIAELIQLQNQLPVGLRFADGAGWVATGSMLSNTITNLAVGASASLIFRAQVVAPGHWINQAQITASSKPDSDSAPGNGFTNGEDDQGQADFRVR